MKKQRLWRWNWISGGWNQCYAYTKEEALTIAKHKGVGVLRVIESSLHAVDLAEFYSGKK